MPEVSVAKNNEAFIEKTEIGIANETWTVSFGMESESV